MNNVNKAIFCDLSLITFCFEVDSDLHLQRVSVPLIIMVVFGASGPVI